MPTYELWMPSSREEPVATFEVVGLVEAEDFRVLAMTVAATARKLGFQVLPNACALRLPGIQEGIGVTVLFAVEQTTGSEHSTVTHILANKLSCKGRTPTHIDLPDPEDN